MVRDIDFRAFAGFGAVALTLFFPCASPAAAPPPDKNQAHFERHLDWLRRVETVRAGWRGAPPPSQEDLRRRLDDSLRRESAFSSLGGRALTGEEVAAEWRRISRETQAPGRLAELRAALGDDLVAAAETLARPALAERRLAALLRGPDRDSNSRQEAETIQQGLLDGSLDPLAPHPRRVTRTYLAPGCPLPIPVEDATPIASPADWQTLRDRWGPLGRPGPVSPTSSAFVVEVLLADAPCNTQVAHYGVPKTTPSSWWGENRLLYPPASAAPLVQADQLSSPPPSNKAGGCDEAWEPTHMDDIPAPREGASAVWTGSEMIVFGGRSGSALGGGGRYDPATDSWNDISGTGSPSPRSWHSAVWTGTEMIVWGGQAEVPLGDGAAYDPAADSWTPLPTESAPPARYRHAAVWTGTEMIIWGGIGLTLDEIGDGARFNTTTRIWQALPAAGAPTPRADHSAVWTGTEMIVWGGASAGTFFGDGAAFSVANGSWRAVPSNSIPCPRRWHSAVWTGTEMIIWGGDGGVTTDFLRTGAAFNPSTNGWRETDGNSSPPGRRFHSAAWTGKEMLVWGGEANAQGQLLNSGSSWDPTKNLWTSLPATGSPTSRKSQSSVWTGKEMLVWGGRNGTRVMDDGGGYDPTSRTWRNLSLGNGPGRRLRHSGIWTGAEFIIWGGVDEVDLGDGAAYQPATDQWRFLPSTGAPSPRKDQTAVWTGTEMILWAGRSGEENRYLDGSRYNPGADSWTPMTTTGAPTARWGHSAVWCAQRMVVFGGKDSGIPTNSGGRYDPLTDSWSPTTQSGAPAFRRFHSAVCTGTEMIVWGGEANENRNDGRRYNPTTDQWTTMSGTGILTARFHHSAIWTGTEMIIWGGFGNGQFGDGARYTPATDKWVLLPNNGAPTPRYYHSGVWTGQKMLVWGGIGSGYFASGGKYDPSTDGWTATSETGAPSPRYLHRGVWDGQRMLVWGGTGSSSYRSGGRYRPGDPLDEDKDGVDHCQDCDDSDNSIYPNAPQLCDGKNNDCEDPNWPAVPSNEKDIDGDGLRPCAGDCDDNDKTTYSGAPQLCDGINNDCNDSNWPAVPTSEKDQDGDGTRPCAGDCDDNDKATYAGAPQLCDGKNNDCSAPGWPTVPSDEADGDGDSYRICGGDCNDADKNVHPGATEVCNSIDDDCDGTVDEGVTSVFYRDADQDGYGNPGLTITGCTPPAGYVTNANDCNDADKNVHPGATEVCNSIDDDCDSSIDEGVTKPFYRDADTDGFGNSADVVQACSAPAGRVDKSGDCNDSDNSIYPGAPQLCDGKNNNCSDPNWPTVPANEADADNDGYRICAGDCNDADKNVHPGATEVCNSIDDDCDSSIDEGVTKPFYRDADTDGFGNSADVVQACSAPAGRVDKGGDCNDSDNSIYPGAPQLCDGKNNDCSDPNWPTVPANEADADNDGYRICAGDCNDSDKAIHPGATEICNSIDDNCDGTADDGTTKPFYLDADGDGFGNSADAVQACTAPPGRVDKGGDCNDNDKTLFPGAPQLCDGKNNDCSDPYWPAVPIAEQDVDKDSVLACAGDCNDNNPQVHPGRSEVCNNGIDDDCDTFTDGADSECAPLCPDADSDGHQSSACNIDPNTGGDCNDSDNQVYPGAPQLCDGKNNDCSDPNWPAVPANELDSDGDHFIGCAGDCNDADPSVYPNAPELCDGKNNNCADPDWPTLPESEQDGDGDSVPTCRDNCPGTANPDQADKDYDASGDLCDTFPGDPFNDIDGDGVSGDKDICPFVKDPQQKDFDKDGIGDLCDTCYTSPNAGEPDPDRDGKQGMCDPDNDGDGTPDRSDPDMDNDGIPNGQDNCMAAPNFFQRDEDSDGRGDACDGEDRLIEYLEVHAKGDRGRPWPWLSWMIEKNAQSYEVYRLDLVTGVAPTHAGDCYHKNLATNFTPIKEDPTPGRAFGYLVAGRFGGIRGSLGKSSAGTSRIPRTSCP